MLVDSHCHLDFDSLKADRADLLSRARKVGVGTMVTIGTSKSNIEEVKQLASDNESVWCTVGIHPHSASSDSFSWEELVRFADHPKVVGIGETGLDYYYDHSSREHQQESFRNHCRAARECGLPLVVHSRNADADTARILEEECEVGDLRGVIHCFSSGHNLARASLQLGFYISISGIVTFKGADSVRAVVESLPTNRLLVETDAPYLAPVPKRGRVNEPAYVAYTAAYIAKIRGVSLGQLAYDTTNNFFDLFQKARRPTNPPTLAAPATE